MSKMNKRSPVFSESLKTGFSFGITSGIITTLGLMVGLHAGTQSRIAVIGGILTIAIADAFSDALGIHIAEESENKHLSIEIWASTFFTFLAKFIIASTFLVPLFLFPLTKAIEVSVIYGLSLLGIFSYFIAWYEGERPWQVVAEHMAIGLLVVILTHYVGDGIKAFFS